MNENQRHMNRFVIVLVYVAVFVNIAGLFHLLWHGQFHPTQYRIVWPKSVSWIPSLSAHVLSALALVVSTFCISRFGGWGRAAVTFTRGCIPAALGIALLASWWAASARKPEQMASMLLLVAIGLVGWSAARAVSQLLGDSEMPSATGEENPPHGDSSGWWRERLFGVVLTAIVVSSVFHFEIQRRLLAMWQYGSPDAGYYAEMLLNVTRGRGLTCEAFGHFFGEHFSPGLYLLVPVFACYPHIETLMALGSVSVMSGAAAVYALASRTTTGRFVPMLLAVAYLLNPSCTRMVYGAGYGFHEILVAVPLMLWSFYFFGTDRLLPACLFALLSISLKENVAVVFAAYGAYLALAGPRRRGVGLTMMIACVAYLLVVVTLIVPSYNEADAYSKLYLYEGLGSSPAEVVAAFIRDPITVASRLFQWHVLGFLLCLLVPLGFLPLRAGVIVAGVPSLVFISLLTNSDLVSIRFWHQASVIPVLWLGAIFAIARLKPAGRQQAAASGLLVCALLTHYALGLSPASALWRRMPLDPGTRPDLIAAIKERIPEVESVQASPRLAAHFVNQSRVLPWHVQSEAPPTWMVFDLSDNFAGQESRQAMTDLARNAVRSGEYVIVMSNGPLQVLRRR
ncbi:MAG: DUF2079 domain-containing protein [Planctomycetota bacterium]|jgi:uncharacterized membrane protein